jgi:hypothetical protein
MDIDGSERTHEVTRSESVVTEDADMRCTRKHIRTRRTHMRLHTDLHVAYGNTFVNKKPHTLHTEPHSYIWEAHPLRFVHRGSSVVGIRVPRPSPRTHALHTETHALNTKPHVDTGRAVVGMRVPRRRTHHHALHKETDPLNTKPHVAHGKSGRGNACPTTVATDTCVV